MVDLFTPNLYEKMSGFDTVPINCVIWNAKNMFMAVGKFICRFTTK